MKIRLIAFPINDKLIGSQILSEKVLYFNSKSNLLFYQNGER